MISFYRFSKLGNAKKDCIYFASLGKSTARPILPSTNHV